MRYRVSDDPTHSLKEYVIRRVKRQARANAVWALRGLTLSVRRGEVVGIIGRNGAGKSTLLKAISRLIKPTEGRIVVRGRVTPLLEVGAGFHPELTGRENVYLNATLLGHSRQEIVAQLDSIVQFSELAAQLDAPIRTYSSGMVARLGFAIGTAWTPDILVLDEVLAVGDTTFQEKCRRRITEMQAQASVVLLVSHAMEEITSMCQRAIWIDGGTVRADGDPATTITRYQDGMTLHGGTLPTGRA